MACLIGQLQHLASAWYASIRCLELGHHARHGARVGLEDEAKTDVRGHDVLGCQVAVVYVANKVAHLSA
jgi:hypothetical protein